MQLKHDLNGICMGKNQHPIKMSLFQKCLVSYSTGNKLFKWEKMCVVLLCVHLLVV